MNLTNTQITSSAELLALLGLVPAEGTTPSDAAPITGETFEALLENALTALDLGQDDAQAAELSVMLAQQFPQLAVQAAGRVVSDSSDAPHDAATATAAALVASPVPAPVVPVASPVASETADAVEPLAKVSPVPNRAPTAEALPPAIQPSRAPPAAGVPPDAALVATLPHEGQPVASASPAVPGAKPSVRPGPVLPTLDPSVGPAPPPGQVASLNISGVPPAAIPLPGATPVVESGAYMSGADLTERTGPAQPTGPPPVTVTPVLAGFVSQSAESVELATATLPPLGVRPVLQTSVAPDAQSKMPTAPPAVAPPANPSGTQAGAPVPDVGTLVAFQQVQQSPAPPGTVSPVPRPVRAGRPTPASATQVASEPAPPSPAENGPAPPTALERLATHFNALRAARSGILPDQASPPAAKAPRPVGVEHLAGGDIGPFAPIAGAGLPDEPAPRAGMSARAPVPPTSLDRLPDQIVRTARFLAREHGGVVQLRLEPQALGRLTLHVTQHHDSVVVELTVQSQHVREMLQEHLPQLRQHLTTQGLVLSQLTVSAETGGQREPTDQRGASQIPLTQGGTRRGAVEPASAATDTPMAGPARYGGLDLVA